MKKKITSNKLGEESGPRSDVVKELHRQRISKFKRRKYVLKHFSDLAQCDLGDMSSMASKNKQFKFFLAMINCFTKQLYVEPIRNKTKEQVLEAFKKLIKRCGSRSVFLSLFL